MLLFVIRDYGGETPLSDLSESLTADMEKMWDEVSKVCLPLMLFPERYLVVFSPGFLSTLSRCSRQIFNTHNWQTIST